jgi:hypothetical protein
VRLRGLTRGFTDDEDEYEDEVDSEERRTLADLGVEPRLFLRATATNAWEIRLELPDLRGLVAKFPDFRNILASQRCHVAGVSGAPLARGVLLSGTHQVTLSRWPLSSEVLLKFAEPIPNLDFLLKTECLLRPGPRWLFKIRGDGTAVEVKTQTIRPGNSYIVLTRTDPGIAFPGIHTVPISVTCEDISAVRFDVADNISRVLSDQMMTVGFKTSLGFRLTPVGLPAVRWDDEGYAEWTTIDSPILAVASDYQIRGIALNLVGPSGARLEVPEESIASTTFIELGHLDPGRYKLHVITETPSVTNLTLAGTLHVTIREPQAWTTDAPVSAAVRMVVSPPSPSLEQIWDGTATVEILGPMGRIGLKIAPSKQVHGQRDVGLLLNILELWFYARTPGDPVSRLHKQQIVAAFRERLIAVLCGDLWVEIERKLNKSATYFVDLKHAISRKPPDLMMGQVLYERRAELTALNSEDITTFLSTLIKNYLDLPSFVRSEGARIPPEQWIADFAYQLMAEPQSVRSWAQSDLDDGLRYVERNPALLRAVRFVVLLRKTHQPTVSPQREDI